MVLACFSLLGKPQRGESDGDDGGSMTQVRSNAREENDAIVFGESLTSLLCDVRGRKERIVRIKGGKTK